MKKTVRFFAIVLAAMILLTVFPVCAFTAGERDDNNPKGFFDEPRIPGFDDFGHNTNHNDPDNNEPETNDPVKLNLRVDYRRQVESGGYIGIVGNVTYEDGTPAADIIFNIARSTSAGINVERTNSEGIFELYFPYYGERTLYFTVYPSSQQYICDPVSFTVYITDASRGITVGSAEHGTASASADTAKLGDIITLNAVPEDGYRLSGWEVVKGDVTVENDSFIMPSAEVEIRPVFEEIPLHTVTIDCGAYGEDIVAEGLREGTRLFEALYEKGVFETLENRETEEYLFRDLVSKPLSEFTDAEAFSDDAYALLNTNVTSDMVIYAGFFKKIKAVELTVKQPVAGKAVTIIDGVQTPAAQITAADGAHCSVSADVPCEWFTIGDNGYDSAFEGAFVLGETYRSYCMLVPDFGYWLDDGTVVTANGAQVEEVSGRMALGILLSAQAVKPAVLGDADGSGEVDIIDATIIQRHLAFVTVPYPEETLMNGDVDGDGELTTVDVTLLQRYFAYIPTKYLIGEPE